LHNITISHRF